MHTQYVVQAQLALVHPFSVLAIGESLATRDCDVR